MASYHHLNKEERIILSSLTRKHVVQKDIARELGRSTSTISRELQRNSREEKDYHAGEAERKYVLRRHTAREKLLRIETNPLLKKYILEKLELYWSPEQIAGRVRKDHQVMVCHETLYRWIYRERPELKKYLRCQKGKYRRRYGTKLREKRREELKKKRIDSRPEIVERRERIGDWEGDTIVGKRGTGSFVTHVDRKSRYTFIDYVSKATALTVKRKTIERFSKLPKQKKLTITYDNGTEFSEYELIGRTTGALVYFAYPYHSWERGTNESTNGLIRQFFPKKSSFLGVTQKEVQRVETLLNRRPRKTLQYLTPEEVFTEKLHLT